MKKSQTKVDAGILFGLITDHLMNFILLENKTKNMKECQYVCLLTKHRFENYLRKAFNDQPLLAEIQNYQIISSNSLVTFSEFIKDFKKMLENDFLLVRQSHKQFGDKPWITGKMKADIIKRTVIFEIFLEKKTAASGQC